MRYLLLGSILALLLPRLLHADAAGGPYQLRRSGFSSGGGVSSAGPYALQSSLFRPDAHSAASGGSFRLTGGLRIEASGEIIAPLFQNGFE